jgi:WD40 repeat protein
VVGSEKEPVRIWDLETGKERFRLASAVNVKALVFSPDGRTLATACQEPTIRLWDTKSGQEKTSYRGDIGKVKLLAFSPDGTTLASWSEQDSWSSRILFWDMASGTQKEPLNLAIRLAGSIGFSPDGQTLAVSRILPDGVDFWNLTTRSKQSVGMGSADPLGGKGWVGAVCFCSDGRRMAFYQEETVVRLWDLDKQREQSVFEVANQAKFPTAALRADGKLAAIGEGNGILNLWNPKTGKKVAVVQASRLHVPYAYFSPDGQTMATHEILESAVKIWDVPTLIGKGK